MKMKTYFVFIVSTLMIVSFFAGAINNENPVNKDGVDEPSWNVGDYWTYDIDVSGGSGQVLDFDLNIDNFKMQVSQVQSDSYILSVNVPEGDVRGSGSVSTDFITISGDLTRTGMSGTMDVKKENLSIVENQVTIDGAIDKLIDIPFTADTTMTFYKFENDEFVPTTYNALQFPLDVGNQWTVPQTFIVLDVDVNLIPQPIQLYFVIAEHDMECTGWETVQAAGQQYDALKIIHSSNPGNKIWYAPDAANIIKVEISNFDMGYGYQLDNLDMILTSTNYEPPNNPPEVPGTPSGPTSGREGPSYTYCTTGTDPDEHQVKYGFDFNNDDSVDKWSDFVDSGNEACVSHSFSSSGTFQIKARTEDKKGAQSGWSSALTVSIAANNAPTAPSTPSGSTTTGTVGESYQFTTSSTDSDGDQIKYGFDLYGDGSDIHWTDLFDSGITAFAQLKWEKKGTFQLRVKAEDQYGKESSWSGTVSVTMENTAPEIPSKPSGETNGKKDKTYTYTTSTTDPEGHSIYYKFDWGDGTDSGWVGPESSGSTASASHSWSQGTYSIKVKAKDLYGEETDWSEPLSVTMPRYNAFQVFFERFIEKIGSMFPRLEQILTRILT